MKPKPLLPILVLFCITSSAQITYKVKTGINLSFFRNYNTSITSNMFRDVDEKRKAGLLLGLTANIKISEDLSLQPELNYTQHLLIVNETYVPPYTNGQPKSSYEMTWHYIDLPLLLRARVYKDFFIEFGPSLSYLLKANFKLTENDFFQIPPNQTGYYSKIYAGLNCGLMYRYKKFEAGIRYSIGLNKVKVNEEYSDPEFDFEDALPFGKHRVVQLTVSYELDESKKNKDK